MSEWVNLLDPLYLDGFSRRQQGPVEAVPTPIPAWNRACGDDGGKVGLGKGWFVTIGGNPKFGKSLLALSLAYEALKHEDVGMLSLEMSHYQLAARFYAIATGTPIDALEKGKGFDVNAFERAWEVLRAKYGLERSVWVNDFVVFRIADVMEAMEALRESGVRYFIVDYIQLIGMGDDDSVARAVAETAVSLRAFAHNHNVTVVGLSQFNRGTSSNYQDSPRCQGLHGGMALEANSDQIVLLDHSRYEKDEDKPHLARSYLIVDGNRHGPSGDIPVLWDYRTLQIREGLPDEENEWPRHGKRTSAT